MTTNIRKQVTIIGAGPSGLLLSHLLHFAGIDTIVLERQTRAYVEGRIRAGVLEWGSVETLRKAGLTGRLDREALVHDGFDLAFHGTRHRIDLAGLTGKSVLIYGQTELTKDMMDRRHADGGDLVFEAENVQIVNPASGNPAVTYQHKGDTIHVESDFVVGCDGYHGASRRSLPSEVVRTFERIYPFGWLGLLSDTPPVAEELIYTNHDNGFALCSQRSETRSRYYLQCSADEKVENWSDDRFWEELKVRLGPETSRNLKTGPSLEKSIAPLRSFVAEPMRYRNLFLAGDAAHIVPPTGAKGLNLAIGDVSVLARGFEVHYLERDTSLLERYSDACLKRVWKAVRFSWYLTKLMHQFPDSDPFEKKMQRTEFDYIMSSPTAARTIAENYVGLPVEI